MVQPQIFVVIPAFNEELNIAQVISELRALAIPLRAIVVADNASTDRTAELARSAGAEVVYESRRGYGSACLCAMRRIEELAGEEESSQIVVFIDADRSDYPEDLRLLLQPIFSGTAELVIGSRMLRPESRGAVPPISRFGNRFACELMFLLYRFRYTDLGPFRAITWSALQKLQMQDRTWGWTLEMQAKACQHGLKIAEVAVRYRERIAGDSKISRSFTGAVRAASKILWVLTKISAARLLYAPRNVSVSSR